MRIARGSQIIEIDDSAEEAQAFEAHRATMQAEAETARAEAVARRSRAVAAVESATGLTVDQIRDALR